MIPEFPENILASPELVKSIYCELLRGPFPDLWIINCREKPKHCITYVLIAENTSVYCLPSVHHVCPSVAFEFIQIPPRSTLNQISSFSLRNCVKLWTFCILFPATSNKATT